MWDLLAWAFSLHGSTLQCSTPSLHAPHSSVSPLQLHCLAQPGLNPSSPHAQTHAVIPASSGIHRARAVAVRPTTGSSSGATVASTRSLQQPTSALETLETISTVWPTSWTSSGVAFLDSVQEQQLLRERTPTFPAALPIARPTPPSPVVRRTDWIYQEATYRSRSQAQPSSAPRESPRLAVRPMAVICADNWIEFMQSPSNEGRLIVVHYHPSGHQFCQEMAEEIEQLARRFGQVTFAKYDCLSSQQQAFARSVFVERGNTTHIYRTASDGSSSLLAVVRGPKAARLRNAIVNSLDRPVEELEFDAGKAGNGYWPAMGTR